MKIWVLEVDSKCRILIYLTKKSAGGIPRTNEVGVFHINLYGRTSQVYDSNVLRPESFDLSNLWIYPIECKMDRLKDMKTLFNFTEDTNKSFDAITNNFGHQS